MKKVKVVGFSPFPYKNHPSKNYCAPFSWYTEKSYKQKLNSGEFLCPSNHTAYISDIKTTVTWPDKRKVNK